MWRSDVHRVGVRHELAWSGSCSRSCGASLSGLSSDELGALDRLVQRQSRWRNCASPLALQAAGSSRLPTVFRSQPIVWVGVNSLRTLTELSKRQAPAETGGVLLGYWRADRRTAVITHIVGPGPSARHGEVSFEPDHEYHLAEIARIYDASGRIATYLGDWHSHPGGSTSLSSIDRVTLARIAATEDARAPRAMMGIAAPSRGVWNFRIWIARPGSSFFNWGRRQIAAELRRFR